MSNRFYNAFDQETLGAPRTDTYRTPFQVDRDRVVYFPSFRRLQAKTQVFLPGEYDFYRTRLTHSIEVAQIGRSLCHHLRAHESALSDEFHLDLDLVEAVCLTHDLGHPPFGHIGERVLNDLLREAGGFEGNAQTLRLVAEKAYEREDGDRGMQPTRALLDGILKYKTLHREWMGARSGAYPEHHFLYDEQEPLRDFVFGTAAGAAGLEPGRALNGYKSIECQVMDWADDTAYSLNDIVDGVAAGFLTREKLELWAEQQSIDGERNGWLRQIFEAVAQDRLEAVFSRKIGRFIQAASLRPRQSGPLSAVTQRHAWDLQVRPEAEAEASFYKSMAVDLIFRSTQIQQIEFKGRHILTRLFEAYRDNYLGAAARPIRILPRSVERRLEQAEGERAKLRVLADHLSGMTDGFALRTYKRLFDPDFSSITELS